MVIIILGSSLTACSGGDDRAIGAEGAGDFPGRKDGPGLVSSEEPDDEPLPTDTPQPGPTWTPTNTPRPAPTWTPTKTPRPPTPRSIDTPTSTPRPLVATCQFQVSGKFTNLWKQFKEELGCPKYQEAYTLQVGEQLFENGHMFYLSDRPPWIFVLFEDGTWQNLQSGWRPGIDPEYSCDNSPPPGRILPKRGFGWIWCNKVNQSKIGWALDREYGFDPGLTYVQDFENGVVYLDSDGANSSGLAYVLFNNGTYTQAQY